MRDILISSAVCVACLLLLQAIDAPPQFIHLPLSGQAQILQEVVEVALHLAFGLSLQLRVLPPQAGQHLIHQGAGLTGIQPSAAHPGLGDAPQALGHQGGGAQATQQQLLQGIAGIHGRCG